MAGRIGGDRLDRSSRLKTLNGKTIERTVSLDAFQRGRRARRAIDPDPFVFVRTRLSFRVARRPFLRFASGAGSPSGNAPLSVRSLHARPRPLGSSIPLHALRRPANQAPE